jgi:hypothetical protein
VQCFWLRVYKLSTANRCSLQVKYSATPRKMERLLPTILALRHHDPATAIAELKLAAPYELAAPEVVELRGCHAALKSVLPHFRCRLGGSTRRKSLYPSSLGTIYSAIWPIPFSGSAVRGLMDATPVCSTGWRCARGSRLHRKCGRTLLSGRISSRHDLTGVTTPKVQNRTLRLRCKNLLPSGRQAQ